MNLLFAVLYIFLAVGANAGVKYSSPAKNPNETDLGSSIEGSEITNDTIQSADIQDRTIVGVDISSNALVDISSITVGGLANSQVTISTGALVNSTKACATGFFRVGATECWDDDGGRAVDVTSVPATGGSLFTTLDLTPINGTKARMATIRVKCQASQDVTEGANAVTLYLRKAGSSVAMDDGTKVCTASNRITSAGGENYTFDQSEVEIPLNSAQDVDFSCTTDATDNDVACYMSVMGYKEQE